MVSRQRPRRRDVQPRGAEMPARERVHHGRLVDQPGMSGVHQDRARPHQPECRSVDEPLRRGRERQMQGYNIAGLEQLPQGDKGGVRAGLLLVVPAWRRFPVLLALGDMSMAARAAELVVAIIDRLEGRPLGTGRPRMPAIKVVKALRFVREGVPWRGLQGHG